MAFPNPSVKGTRGLTVGLLVLFVLGASLACDARELVTVGLGNREPVTSEVSVLQINQQELKGQITASEEVGRNENVCTLCEEYVAEALMHLEENETQTEILDTLHKICSHLLPFEEQCVTLVDYYVPLLFKEIESVLKGDFCQKVNLCKQRLTASLPLSEDKCEICHHAIAEVLLKLKDPDTKLDIIASLLKACDAVESYVKKCKTMVFEYGPLILANAEQFLEKTDICTAIHACDLPSAGGKQASPMEKTSLLSVL